MCDPRVCGALLVRRGIFAAHFAAAKWAYGAAKWHSCALRNGGPTAKSKKKNFCFGFAQFILKRPILLRFKSKSCTVWSVGLLTSRASKGDKVCIIWAPGSTPKTCPTVAKWGCSCDISGYCLHSHLDFDHPKTYITSKQIKIKAFKSKFKQVINKTKRYGLASL